MMATADSAYRFGNLTLGPVLLSFLASLDDVICHFAIEKNAKILFCSRAGVRILRLYQLYLDQKSRKLSPNIDLFWISRFMCAKGIWNKDFQASCKLLEDEFRYAEMRDVISAIYRTTELPSSVNLNDKNLSESGRNFSSFIWGDSDAAYHVRWHLTEQSELFKQYLTDLVGSHDTILLVDSGWQGTVQNLLTDFWPEIDWWGSYFGRSGSKSSDRRYWNKMIGLALESDFFESDQPQTAVVLHRHLIEGLFEPKGVSIEHYINNSEGIIAPGSVNILADDPDISSEPLFVGVSDYIRSNAGTLSIAGLVDAARPAWQRLARTIIFPTIEEAHILGGMQRSADFGRDILVPLLLEPVARYEGDNSEARIQNSLWPAAQAALEYPAEVAVARQQLICGKKIRPSDFSVDNAPYSLPLVASKRQHPTVAVITRTMDRPIFLRRALTSVSNQDYEDYIHIIVCDGGNVDDIQNVIQDSSVDKRKTILVDNVVNRGMEAASNIGIRLSESEFVVIHDDDDTWEPQFLSRMVAFLCGPEGRKYGGAVSHTWYVSEEVTQRGIKTRSQKPYHDWVNNIQLMEMAQENFFAPIAFLFRRSIYNDIGGFDERFPVLGDWDFNLRFLAVQDIGVVPEKLANYHHRDVGNTALFPNSVTASISKHAEFNSILRNKYVRADEMNGDGRIGAIVALGMSLNDMRITTRRTLSETERLSTANQHSLTPSHIMTRLEILQTQNDEFWLAIQWLQSENSNLYNKLADFNSRFSGLEKAFGDASITNMLFGQKLEDLQRLADERWLALQVLFTSGNKP